MSETIDQTIWHKMRYTPMRDFLRGKLTSRMDLRRPLEDSELPPPVKRLIHRVVRRTFLWRLERLEVTQELISHFSDGIEAGSSSDDLIKKFGDETQAAKLIRRSKRRNRPLPWQVLRIAAWPMVLVMVFYFGYAMYFFAGQPSPRVQYVTDINRAIEKTPLEDRAWPLYRRALLGIGPLTRQELSPAFGRKEWQRLLLVKEHPVEVEWIHQGAAKPTLGFLIGASGSAYDDQLWPEQKRPTVDPAKGEELISAAMPPMQFLRTLAEMLRFDAVLARQTQDRNRLLRDIHSMLGLSRQIGEDAPLLWGLMSLSTYQVALDQIEQTLREEPGLLRKEDWIAIAKRLSEPKVAADLITFDAERRWFDDQLQRSFTDDGSGNGRFTPEGVKYIDTDLSGADKRLWREILIHPAVSLLVPSRQKLAKEYSQLVDRASANLKLPMRDADWRSVKNALEESRKSFPDSISPVSFAMFIPSFWLSQATAEQYLGRRDGLVVGIALEVYRHKHGHYPETLNLLVPHSLPELPLDRITGQALRYRLVDGQPLVYSVGGDRKDDAGRAPRRPDSAANWGTWGKSIPDGDWALYPTTKRGL